MATEKTTKSSDKTEKKDKPNGGAAADGGAPTGVGFTQGKGGDTAGKTMSKDDILALHRKKAEAKEIVTSDVVGYWDSDGEIPITGVPEVGVIATDSGIDKTKPSMLMKWKVTIPTVVVDKDSNENVCQPGDLVGVWYKPGMRDVRTLGGVEVTMFRNEAKDKDTGKGNPMKAFEVRGPRGATGQLLRITEDRRERSASAATIFDVKQDAPPSAAIPRNAPPTTVYDEGDKLPF